MSPLDLRDADALAPSAQALARVRAQLAPELARPTRRWRREAALSTGALLGFTALLAGALAVGGQLTVVSPTRALSVALLAASLAAVGWLAVAPPRRWGRAAAVGSVAAVVAAVALRGAGQASASPQWLCTVSHLGADLLPIALALAALRTAAPTRARVLAAGCAAGLPGFILGELACGRGALHVLLFHLPAWGAALLLTAAIGPRLQPRSFAP